MSEDIGKLAGEVEKLAGAHGTALYDEDRALLREAAAALAQQQDTIARQWQPIETAPRNGSRILLAANVHDPSGCLRSSVGRYTDEPYWTPATGVIGAEQGFQCDGDDCIPSNQECFTHWMPLPAPPIDAAREGALSQGAGESDADSA